MTPLSFVCRCLFLFALVATAFAGVAAVEHDLGRGLIYVRVHKLPADLPAKPEGQAPACVLDLRFVEAGPETATAFGAWLKFRAAPRSPVFVVVNAGTSAALLRTLRANSAAPGVISIGPSGGPFTPDSVVRISPEEEKKAYDAFENGVAITALIADQPNKVRIDEASLSKERVAEPAEGAGGAAAAPRPQPLVDAAVQRAVHLHRSLLAFKKI